MEQKEGISIKAHPTSIEKLKTEGSSYYLTVKEPEEKGREYNNTVKFTARGISFIVNTLDDAVGKPATTSLVGKNVMAFYDNNQLMAVKPYVLYLRPKIN